MRGRLRRVQLEQELAGCVGRRTIAGRLRKQGQPDAGQQQQAEDGHPHSVIGSVSASPRLASYNGALAMAPTPDQKLPWTARMARWADPGAVRQYEDKVLLLLTLIIGAVVGLVVVAFILVTENLGSRLYPANGAPWRRLVIPVAGALITGILLARYFPNARGSGIPQTKTALFIRDGFISLAHGVRQVQLSAVSLASGIALGREGPSVQVPAGIASVLGRRLGLSPAA